MRGSIVVLALVASPFVASISRAQGNSHAPKRTEVPIGAKCDPRDRGNSSNVASQTGLDNRVDPTTRGQKNCAPPTPQSVGHSFITGTLFNDANGNGVWDSGEWPLVGWTVQLTGAGVSQTSVTDANGLYSFSSLNAGTYTVCVVPPGGWLNTSPASGSSCPGSSFGYSIDAPAGLSFDLWFTDYNFGFQSM